MLFPITKGVILLLVRLLAETTQKAGAACMGSVLNHDAGPFPKSPGMAKKNAGSAADRGRQAVRRTLRPLLRHCFLSTATLLFAPVAHRFLHRLHAEDKG